MKALERKKKDIYNYIAGTTNSKSIDKIHKICEEDDWWLSLSDADKADIEEGLKDIEEGRIVSYAMVKKRMSKWLKK